MRPILFELPFIHWPIFGYGMMLCVALIATMWLSGRLARNHGLNPDHVYDLGIWVFLFGIIGARLFWVIQYRDRIDSFAEVFQIWNGGIVLYGGILGGTIGGLIHWSRVRYPLRAMLDVLAPSIGLGIALGRIGCFLNGCCYGDACDLPVAVRFPVESPAWWQQVRDRLPEEERLGLKPMSEESLQRVLRENPPLREASLPVHPTQLYSSIDGFLLMVLTLSYYPIRRRDGEVIALLMIALPITRFLIEFLRNDEGVFLAGMTISQAISIWMLMGGLAFWFWIASQPRLRHEDQLRAANQATASPSRSEPT